MTARTRQDDYLSGKGRDVGPCRASGSTSGAAGSGLPGEVAQVPEAVLKLVRPLRETGTVTLLHEPHHELQFPKREERRQVDLEAGGQWPDPLEHGRQSTLADPSRQVSLVAT